jgi:Zinc metalloprotease (elastase)
VAAHEMSHGVVQNTANLNYQGESGAINESFADVFGSMVDRDDWLIGEDVVNRSVFTSGALRSLMDPNNGGTRLGDNGYQPKSVSEQYFGSENNGGVHINSGIPNHAFTFLLFK